jgi:hypothetical protein
VRVRYHGSRAMNSLAVFYKDVTGIIAQSSEFYESVATTSRYLLKFTKFNKGLSISCCTLTIQMTCTADLACIYPRTVDMVVF